MKLNEIHLAFMLKNRNVAQKVKQLSATKLRAFGELETMGLMKQDEDGFIFNSETGDNVLDIAIQCFDDVGNS